MLDGCFMYQALIWYVAYARPQKLVWRACNKWLQYSTIRGRRRIKMAESFKEKLCTQYVPVWNTAGVFLSR